MTDKMTTAENGRLENDGQKLERQEFDGHENDRQYIERTPLRIIYELPTSKVERNGQPYSSAIESDKCAKLKGPQCAILLTPSID